MYLVSKDHAEVCLKMVSTPKPNGFADHYPYEKWLFHWEYTQHFQTNPLWNDVFHRSHVTLAELAVDAPAVYQPLILNDRWGGDPSTLRDVHVKSVQVSRTPEARESVKQE